jgi:hypothetical protein
MCVLGVAASAAGLSAQLDNAQYVHERSTGLLLHVHRVNVAERRFVAMFAAPRIAQRPAGAARRAPAGAALAAKFVPA